MVEIGGDNNRDDECEAVGIGCALEHFSEAEEVLGMIDNIKNIYNTQEFEVHYDKLYTILKLYYEQPHLLDTHLDLMLTKFINIIKDKESSTELKHATFDYMYQVIRVRGYKVVVRHLPHEVSDLLTVLTFLETQDPKDKQTWRSRFVLILWLSIIVIIPFHMSRLDGITPQEQEAGTSKKLTVMERIFNICKTYALTTDACAEAGAYLTSKFIIRSDVKELYMGALFDWACDLHSDMNSEKAIHYGVLAAVAAVLKHGKRDDLLPYTRKLLDWVTKQNYKAHNAKLVRKYGVKIVQRIGLTFLRPRVATWRYTRGSRSLASTLGGAPVVSEPVTPTTQVDDDDDIPQEVEDVVELLLWSLRDEDTVVRWCAAKGIGRIGARLHASAAADVAECVLSLFTDTEREGAWHGGCMALAELCRRGLLAPEQLAGAVKGCVCALRKDECRAGGGGAVRDAACHASWALARAYDAQTLAPHMHTLANALIATACFDREINCRRAASAAYQENVGRHGMFPHGIDVLTEADFQSVGPRNNAYLHVAPTIAKYTEYSKHLIDHLVELKVEHWDCAIRELAAKSLHKLTFKMPLYVANDILPKLVSKVDSIDLNVRHGAVLAIGEVTHALSLIDIPDGKKADSLISEDVRVSIRDLIQNINDRRLFRGMGGELMRQACCQCIAALSQAKAPFHGHSIIDEWLNLIDECLAHDVQVIREKAITALPYLIEEYLHDDDVYYDGVSSKAKRDALVDKFCQQLSNTGVNGLVLRMGHARALGLLPKFVLLENLPRIMQALIHCTKITGPTSKWAESRRDAVIGLTAVCQTLGIVGGIDKYYDEIVDTFLDCLSEYTVDMRGDIGAWVREATMTGLLSLCRQCAVEAPHLNSDVVITKVMSGIAQQAVEKIDRTRACAGKIFTTLLYNDPIIENIPHHEALKRIFPPEEIELPPKEVELEKKDVAASESGSVVLWLFPEHTMPRFVQLLGYDVYRYNLIKGLIVSGGELTESLVKHTTTSLYSYLNSLHNNMELLKAICDTIIKVFADNINVKRIAGPVFNFLDRLLSSGSISPVLEDPESTFAMDVLKYLKLELKAGKNIYKLLDSMNVLCQLIQVGGEVCEKALGQLVLYLCYSDCYFRRTTAARLYEALTLYGDVSTIPEDNLDSVMTILAETDWDREVTALRPIRNDVCDLMNIKQPVPKQVKPPS